MEYWVKNKTLSRHGLTLDEFKAQCDLGQYPGLEMGFELEEIWDEASTSVVGVDGEAGSGRDRDIGDGV